MIRINLVPAELLIQQRQRQQILQAALVGVAFAALFVFMSMLHWNKARRLDNQLAVAEAKLKTLESVVRQVEELQAKAREVQARLTSIENLRKGRFEYTRFFQDVVESLPGGVWLLNLNTNSAETKVSFNTSAMARTKEDVAVWVRTLENDSRFESVELGAITMSGEAGYAFTVRCAYNYTPPEAYKGGK